MGKPEQDVSRDRKFMRVIDYFLANPKKDPQKQDSGAASDKPDVKKDQNPKAKKAARKEESSG